MREFAQSSCAVGATHRDTEIALFQISEEEEQENDGTEVGVMKKCLCVRGLKNSPFRVVCLLAEQRQGSVSEICCKDYLVCILYQGTANRIFFLRLALAVPHLLRKDSSFLCIPPLGPRSSLAPFSPLHSSSHLSLSENTSFQKKLQDSSV